MLVSREVRPDRESFFGVPGSFSGCRSRSGCYFWGASGCSYLAPSGCCYIIFWNTKLARSTSVAGMTTSTMLLGSLGSLEFWMAA